MYEYASVINVIAAIVAAPKSRPKYTPHTHLSSSYGRRANPGTTTTNKATPHTIKMPSRARFGVKIFLHSMGRAMAM